MQPKERTLGATFCAVALLVGITWPASIRAQPPGDVANGAAGQQATTAQGNAPISPDTPRRPPGAILVGGGEGYALVPVSQLAQLEKPEEKTTDSSKGDLSAIAALLNSIAWPLVVVFLALRLLRAPQVQVFIAKISQRATQISVAGLEIKLTEGAKAALEDVQALISQVPETHHEWIANSHLEGKFQRVVTGIRGYLCEINAPFTAALPDADFKKFRFTLHVPDVLLTHSMRQLVDYVGASRGGVGRIFSTRRGIVGLAWRREKSLFETRTYCKRPTFAY